MTLIFIAIMLNRRIIDGDFSFYWYNISKSCGFNFRFYDHIFLFIELNQVGTERELRSLPILSGKSVGGDLFIHFYGLMIRDPKYDIYGGRMSIIIRYKYIMVRLA